MSVWGVCAVYPDLPEINENDDSTTIEIDIDFNFEGEECAFFEEGIGAVNRSGLVFPQVNNDIFGMISENDYQLSPIAITDIDAFVEPNSLMRSRKNKRSEMATPMFEMPSLKRSIPSCDASFDVSISQERMQKCTSDFFSKRVDVTFEFCPNMRTWSVLLYHGAQMCELSFQMSAAGTASEQKIRFSGKLENGSTAYDTLNKIMSSLKDIFEENNNNKMTGNASNSTSNSTSTKASTNEQATTSKANYTSETNLRVLDMMIALASDKTNLSRQLEGVQCLADMSLDEALLPTLVAHGATQALAAAYEACAKEAPPSDPTKRNAYYTMLFSESATVSHLKHEIACHALAGLAYLSADFGAMNAIISASGAWKKMNGLHSSFTTTEWTVYCQHDDPEVKGKVPCLVNSLVNSLERLRRRAMMGFSCRLQKSNQAAELQCGTVIARSMSSTNVTVLSGSSSTNVNVNGSAEVLAHRVAELGLV